MKQINKADDNVKPIRLILPAAVILFILIVVASYTYVQKKNVIKNTELVVNRMGEYISESISEELGFAESSIKLSAVTIAQTMDSQILDNPSEVIAPMVENTPFGAIEYIQADGMNVMNIGEPFDASDRVYYQEGIKGNTGIWNNFHPKTSQETLINFYTPLVYGDEYVGVITGYIEATSQIAAIYPTSLYGQPIQGLLVDENNMVICSTKATEFVKDYTLEMYLDEYKLSDEHKQKFEEIIDKATLDAVSYKEPKGNGRICVTLVPGTEWKVVLIVPQTSFDNIIAQDTRASVIAIGLISAILLAYAAYVLLRNVKGRIDATAEKNQLQAVNEEIKDIIASANMGTWRIELFENEEPRMYIDDTMKMLLGILGQDKTPEEIYSFWFTHIEVDAVQSVLDSVAKMQNGSFDENTYLWIHPTKGERYVRCGGTSHTLENGYVLRGYHYDVDDTVREEQAQVAMLRTTLEEKNEYYSTLGTLSSVFYSMHVLNLLEDTAEEFIAQGDVKKIVNRHHGATQMMVDIMTVSTNEEYREAVLAFTDLSTLADRMLNKKIISKQFLGNNIGWCLASFITMEEDEGGRPIKVICTTRSIDQEKKQEETLIKKSHTDELTGLLNRRAYMEEVHAHKDKPEEDEFVFMSLDVNGLKVVNDSLGHMAGDELLTGACECMKKSLGKYGKLFRTGGDEFVAVLFCSEAKLREVLEDFDDTVASWSGKLVDSVSISYGWVSRDEMPDVSVRQLEVLADERMYASKEAHYKKQGVDRRGQKDAHKALCDLYTKILKINITDDTYQIINMDVKEQSESQGFADSISQWFKSFGESGQVHPDDLDEYLKSTDLQFMRDYFAGDKTSLHVFYKRKFGDEYKQVLMEIIPANDYSNDNQTLFLYVKNIEK